MQLHAAARGDVQVLVGVLFGKQSHLAQLCRGDFPARKLDAHHVGIRLALFVHAKRHAHGFKGKRVQVTPQISGMLFFKSRKILVDLVWKMAHGTTFIGSGVTSPLTMRKDFTSGSFSARETIT